MNDAEIHQHINDLVAEEHALQRGHAGRPLSDEERNRLSDLNTQLDRTWDLLRQRQARIDAGENPDEAQERSARVVEDYRQ